ncbi:hypothetical protein C8R47DRAFT_510893 [Mycena vitilis]|nr:hypothetical protein C8R47DRAFT_510893 [Mycena vitilis]
MSHTSPASYLVWAIISCILFVFLLFHLWSFDRFKCLKWNNGPYSGAFKRVMTYSYLLSVPLLTVYAIVFAVIKYQQGFVVLDGAIMPKPYFMWPEADQRAIFPLTLMFSIGWSMEMITHLEELCFWLFLVNSGSGQQDWFRSWYFRSWIVGSCVAIIYLPILAIVTRDDVIKCEAYVFLGGSLGGLSITLWFLPVLWAFPAFLANLKSEGVDTGTIVRLTKFHELNTIRVVFRFVMVIPFLMLGSDGVRPHVHLNENMFATDFLVMIAGFGCSISSALTLVIFFPRSVEGEIAAKDAARDRRRNRGFAPSAAYDNRSSQYTEPYSRHPTSQHITTNNDSKRLSFPPPSQVHSHSYDGGSATPSPQMMHKEWPGADGEVPELLMHQPALRPNRRRGEDVEMGGFSGLTEGNLSQHNLRRNASAAVNPLVHNFRSPLDVYSNEQPPTRLTFTPR